jgi:hypothetical protein
MSSFAEPGWQQVRVEVAAEQHRLEENQAGAPDRGCAAQDRQDEPANHGLHQKEQSGTEE